MSNARDKANIPALNFSSTGIDDNATSTAITIDSSERVGIGTASPAGNLHVEGGEIFFKNNSGNSKVDISASDSGNSVINLGDTSDGDVGRILYEHANNSLQFKVNATERMRIDSSGNVSVGTTTPYGKLNVSGGTSTDLFVVSGFTGGETNYNMSIRNPSTNKISFRQRWFTTSQQDTEVMSFASGNVGIGTSSPTQKLDVNGTVKATAFQGDGSALTGVGGANTPAFEAYLSTNQSFSDTTFQKVEFDTEVYDTNSDYDNSTSFRFTPTTAGKYFVYSNIVMYSTGGSTIQDGQIVIYKNGSQYKQNDIEIDTETRILLTTNATIDMNGSSDYLEIYVYLNVNAGTPTLRGAAKRCNFGAFKLIT
jgi:hypothetical protein